MDEPIFIESFEGTDIRFLLHEDDSGEEEFYAVTYDVAKATGYADSSSISNPAQGGEKIHRKMTTPSGTYLLALVNQRALERQYSMTDKPAYRKFYPWVRREVYSSEVEPRERIKRQDKSKKSWKKDLLGVDPEETEDVSEEESEEEPSSSSEEDTSSEEDAHEEDQDFLKKEEFFPEESEKEDAAEDTSQESEVQDPDDISRLSYEEQLNVLQEMLEQNRKTAEELSEIKDLIYQTLSLRGESRSPRPSSEASVAGDGASPESSQLSISVPDQKGISDRRYFNKLVRKCSEVRGWSRAATYNVVYTDLLEKTGIDVYRLQMNGLKKRKIGVVEHKDIMDEAIQSAKTELRKSLEENSG